jgi:hypothetical protein
VKALAFRNWLALALWATFCAEAFSQKTKPLPLPPIRYHIQFWDVPNPGGVRIPQSMNNHGQVVGHYKDTVGQNRAFLYDSILPETALDLEELIGGRGIPVGWSIRGAMAINRHGLVVGALGPSDNGPARAAFVLDLNAESPEVIQLPNWGEWSYYIAVGINDAGDILGVARDPDDGTYLLFFYNPTYAALPLFLPGAGSTRVGGGCFLNNQVGELPAQVGGTLNDGSDTPFRWTPATGDLRVFSGLNNEFVFGMNDSGTMCGYTDVTTSSGSGKNATTTTQRYPMRLSTLPANVLTRAPGQSARSINAAGDVLISNGTIYRDDWGAFGNYVDVNKLVVGTPDDLAIWSSADSKIWWYMNDRRTANDCGQIMGSLSINGVLFQFLLSPVPAP